jgi:cytoskeletal protein RodZ
VGAFGEKLRKQREQRGIALDAISTTTKISTRMLRALEDEHFDQLPGGVFNKGFVRAYARQVGLDEEEAIADYLAALRESQIQQQSILPDFRAPAAKTTPPAAPKLRPNNVPDHDLASHDLASHDLPGADGHPHGTQLSQEDPRKHDRRHLREDPPPLPDSTTHVPAANPPAERFPKKYPAGDVQPIAEPSTRIPWGNLALALLLVTLALAFWNFRRRREPAAQPQPALASNQSPTPAPAPVSTPALASAQPSGSPGTLTAGSALPPETLSPGSLSPAAKSAATNSTKPAPPAATDAATNPPRAAAQPPMTPAANQPARKSTAPAATSKPPATFTLLIRAEKTTWVLITVDGKPVAQETLIAPAHTSVRATREIVVRAGNAAGISFLLNGKEFPAQGTDGEVKTYVFDATTVRVLPPTQSPAANR